MSETGADGISINIVGGSSKVTTSRPLVSRSSTDARVSITEVRINDPENVQIITGNNNTGSMVVNRTEDHETFLIKRFEQMKEVFVETERYRKAREVLIENGYVIITGPSGEGKSFLAMKLIHDKIQEGYKLKEIKSSNDFASLEVCEKMIFLLEDRLKIDNHDTQFLILEIENFIEERKQNNEEYYLIIISRSHPLSVMKKKMRHSWLLSGNSTVDLGNIELTQGEKYDIITNHLQKFQKKTDRKLMKEMAKEICEIDCSSFANRAYFFVRSETWFNKGISFFKDSDKIIDQEVDSLIEIDPEVYLLLIYLLLKGGNIKGNTLDDCHEDDNVIQILEKVKTYPKKEYCRILNTALKRVEYVYVSRVGSTSGTYTFRHDRIVEAVCLSFSKILPREAILNVPFEFILKRMRTAEYKTDIQDMIIITEDRYVDLALRFRAELKLGNIKGICEHPAMNNARFIGRCIGKLQLPSFVQITERACGSTLDGSLLYWSASCGTEYLCNHILESGIYSQIRDQFWVRIQASAALVPSCWFGFSLSIIDKLLELGADMDSSMHKDRSFQTYTSSYLAVHDQTGWTPIQAAVCGTNENKAKYVQSLIAKGCKFRENKMMQRPLIHAVKQGNIDLVHVLLKSGINIHAVDLGNQTSLYCAVDLNHVDIAKLLLEKVKRPLEFLQPKSIEMIRLLKPWIDIEMKDADGKTLLHHTEDAELVEFLVEQGLPINSLDEYKRTPLYYANKEEVVQILLKHGALLSCVDHLTNETFFHVQRNVEIVSSVLDGLSSKKKRELINMKNSKGIPPIFKASSEIFQCLIQHGADVNTKCSYAVARQITALDIHSGKDDEPLDKKDFVRKFLSHPKASLTSNEKSSLTDCTYDEDSRDIELTFENTENYSKTDITVVMKLASEGKLTLNLLELCLENGYQFDIGDGDDRTFLHHILFPEHRLKDVCKLLDTILKHAELKKGEDFIKTFVNHRDKFGNTALHRACSCSIDNKLKANREIVIDSLIKYGADPNILNEKDEKPEHNLMKCRCCSKQKILRTLRNGNEQNVLDSFQDISLIVNLFKTCASSKRIKEVILSDSREIIQFLLTEHKISIPTIVTKFIELDANPNIVSFILMSHLESLDVPVRKQLYTLCIEKKNINSGITLVFMPLDFTESGNKSLFTQNSARKIFEFCVQMLVEEKFLMAALKKLFQKDIDVNVQVQNKENYLLWTLKDAPELNRRNVLKFLFEKGTKLENRKAIRHCLQAYGEDVTILDCLKVLLQYGAPLSEGCPLIWTLEASNIRPNTMEFIINHKDTNFQQKDEFNKTVFHCFLDRLASPKQSTMGLRFIRLLLQKININNPLPDETSPFTLTLKYPKISAHIVIEALLNLLDINAKDSIGRTPLHSVFCYYGGGDELEIVKHIVKLGGKAGVSVVDNKGNTCLHLLVSRMKYDTVKILLYLSDIYKDDRHCLINAKDFEDNSVLHSACSINREDPSNDMSWCASLRVSVVRILIAHGADINATNNAKQTVLHTLVQSYIFCQSSTKFVPHTHPIVEMINILIEHGIDQTVKDKEGKTAIQYIQEETAHLKLLKDLISREAKPEDLIRI